MEKRNWKPYVFFIALSEAVGLSAALLTRDGMEQFADLAQPDIMPPAIVFVIVWIILYALMGIGAARVFLSESIEAKTGSLIIFVAQLAVNFFWSLIFFNQQAFGYALLWLILLWILIVIMILSYRMADRTAAWLQLPYLIWVTFAGYLNYLIWVLN